MSIARPLLVVKITISGTTGFINVCAIYKFMTFPPILTFHELVDVRF